MAQINIGVDGTALSILNGQVPGLSGAYLYSLTDVPGVVAANNFMTLVNPVGSGKRFIYLGSYISTYVTGGASTTRNSMQLRQCGVASAGTVVAASNFVELDTTFPASVADVRTGNPTVTAGNNIANSPPPIGTTTGQYVHAVGLGFGSVGGGYVIRPGEGVVFQTAVGNTSQTWNISIGWAEAV